jgi:hypothetical protein
VTSVELVGAAGDAAGTADFSKGPLGGGGYVHVEVEILEETRSSRTSFRDAGVSGRILDNSNYTVKTTKKNNIGPAETALFDFRIQNNADRRN